MEIKSSKNNSYFCGYNSSKYMKNSYTTNSLTDPRTNNDDVPKSLDLQDKKEIWGYSSNKLEGVYNFFGFSSPTIDAQSKKILQDKINIFMKRLSGSGLDASSLDMIVRLVQDKKLSMQIMLNANKDYKISKNISDDLDKLYGAYINNKDVKDVFVPQFQDKKEAAQAVNIGDVCTVKGDKNISIKMPDGEIKELFITPETYLELFPPVERYIITQHEVGDCYLLSSTNTINENPLTRYKLLEMFRENSDDTVDIVLGGFENQNGSIVPKNPENMVLEDIASLMPEHRLNHALSCTCEGIRAIELLFEYQNRAFSNSCTQRTYDDFKENGLNASICNFRPYTQDEIQYFMSYIDEHGLDSMFCLQDVNAMDKFTLKREEVEQQIQKLKQNDDDKSKYKVLILQRMLKAMDRTGAPSDCVFGDALPKEFLLEFFEDVVPADLYCNNAGHTSDMYKKYGLKVIHDKVYVNEAKEQLFAKNPLNFVYTCGTSKEKAANSDGKFMSGHAYSLIPIDINGERKFAIKNPHNTMEEIILSYDELCEHFNKVTVAKI